jgi:drug/metabolite transporter (DMT)-like permease
MMTAWLCFYSASRSLPLGQLTTFYFVAPLVITLMAARLLGEHVSRARWTAVSIGFVGAMFASDPFGVTASLPTLRVLAAAAMWAYGIILMRRIARQETSLLQMLFSNMVFVVTSGVASIPTWHPPVAIELPLLLTVGVFGGLAQFSVFEAARLVPASVLATVEYSALLWAFLLGFVVWDDVPAPMVALRAGPIAGARVLLVVTERRTTNARG